MSRQFRFVRTHDNRFLWEGRGYRVSFSEPMVTMMDDYALWEKNRRIMYFYYYVDLYEPSHEEKSGSKLFAHEYVSDFPAIYSLRYILDTVLSEPIRKNSRKTTVKSDDDPDEGYYYSKYLDTTNNLIYEDFYSVKRTYYTETKGEWFDVTVGVGSNLLRFPMLGRADILELKRCVNCFLKYARKTTNERIRAEAQWYKERCFIENGRLFCMDEFDGEKFIRSIFRPGDELRSFRFMSEDESRSRELDFVKISSIDDGAVFIDTENDGAVRIPIERIREISHFTRNVPDIQGMAREFADLLGERVNEFCTADKSELIEKYRGAVSERYGGSVPIEEVFEIMI